MKNLREIEELEDLGITLSDGCRLSARVWRPVDAEDNPVPVVLEYLPYRKRDGTCARDALTHPYFARRGYACVRVDMRGNGDSEGVMEDEYTVQEQADAVEVIDWLAEQPWCNGNVGMMGISWGGFNGLQVAALAPDALKAVITLCSTVDRYADDIHYKGGCLLNENLGWGSTMWAYSSRPPDPALREDWREIWMQRLEAEPFLPEVWLRHQHRDAYWKHGSICEDYSTLKAKVLAIGGWGDAYKNAVPQIIGNLPGSKGIVGPWVHKYPHFAVPEPRIGFLQEALRWWDKWLKGIETGVEEDPDLSLYLMDGVRPKTWYEERPGRWVTHAPGKTGRYPLGPDGVLGQAGAFEVAVASPADTGMEGGEYCAIWLGPEMPGDQRPDDAKSACWDSAPLDHAVEIAGAPEMTLRLRSEKAQGQVAVRLNHVHPDGASTRITYGMLNLTHRGGHETPVDLPLNQGVEIRVALDHIAYVVPKGHRIRVAVSNAYWPLIWPAPEAGALTVTGGQLTLPTQADGMGGRTFLPPETDEPWQIEELRPANNSRKIERNMGSGEVHLIIEDDFGKRYDKGHGLVSGGMARERWSIHPDDPLSAKGETHWTEEVERDGICLRTETFAEMTSDLTHFHFSARLEAYENDIKVFDKEFKDRIRRKGL
ncbi:CocE/NonD family hydrolase [Alisedimentitalea sp. MJ-SS2]|uniref:CocE/NonD family hydrolase n=1 Tax=Aliisedimentitalea sp. MJ-SS2 TaxID=3049795 RepID=UPI00290BF77B|nr:CocE/NonD family hydrolase [Alisedimentitalea sp. MJ-SS2]MDU8927495.1 CocE/NonD family hydrolase [Alisedimentitalea sp. MJ-SS2]